MMAKSIAFNNGHENIEPALLSEVTSAIANSQIQIRRGNARRIRADILRRLAEKGWSGEVVVTSSTQITITSQKSGVGLCLQLGNMARMYADLLKLQTMFANGVIFAGMIILPEEQAAKTLGSNIANATRLARELQVFNKVITLPLNLLILEMEREI